MRQPVHEVASNVTSPFAPLIIPGVRRATLRHSLERGAFPATGGRPVTLCSRPAALARTPPRMKQGHERPRRGKVQMVVPQTNPNCQREIEPTPPARCLQDLSRGGPARAIFPFTPNLNVLSAATPFKFGNSGLLFCNPLLISVSWRRFDVDSHKVIRPLYGAFRFRGLSPDERPSRR